MIFTLGQTELDELLIMIKTKLPDGGVVILRGDLAAGKTTLVSKFVKFMGGGDSVTSPTFSIQNCYENNIFHYDIYNHGFEHFLSLGMFEELEKEGFHFVEWGEENLISLLKRAGFEAIVIDIEKFEAIRKYRVEEVSSA
jgi:tRNA threonylcarbamoyladenosine biosynthesis protein TsaE